MIPILLFKLIFLSINWFDLFYQALNRILYTFRARNSKFSGLLNSRKMKNNVENHFIWSNAIKLRRIFWLLKFEWNLDRWRWFDYMPVFGTKMVANWTKLTESSVRIHWWFFSTALLCHWKGLQVRGMTLLIILMYLRSESTCQRILFSSSLISEGVTKADCQLTFWASFFKTGVLGVKDFWLSTWNEKRRLSVVLLGYI